MFQANDKGTRITLTEAALVLFLLLTLNMFLFLGVLLKSTTQKNFEKFRNFQENIAQFLRSKTDVCSVYMVLGPSFPVFLESHQGPGSRFSGMPIQNTKFSGYYFYMNTNI